MTTMNAASVQVLPKSMASTRFISLDVLRGITIAFMIMVNNPGDGDHAFWAMKHADWNGFTPTDLVFPTFLFIVGMTTVFSFDSRLKRGDSKVSIFLHSLSRAIILFLLGLVVNSFPFFSLATLRIYGVLQRIAICFLCAGVFYLWDRRARSKITIVIVVLLGYWILLRYVRVPGYGFPVHDIPLLDKDANLVAWLDRHILSAKHLYGGGWLPQGGTRDPEGLLSNLPALCTTLLGMLAAIWFRAKGTLRKKVGGLLASGVLLLGLALIWNHWFPINKQLWTSSFVLYAAGWTLLALAFCFWAVEINGWKRGWTAPLLVFGTNAITAYVFSELLASALNSIPMSYGDRTISLQRLLFLKVFAPVGNLGIASLLYSFCFVLVCAVPVTILYRRRIFIKI